MPTAAQRLLSLLSLLQTPRVWAGSEIADRLGVSPRTIRRDIDRLRELGYPVDAIQGGQGGYRLVSGAAMPPLALDDEEAVAVAVGLRLATTHPLKANDDAAVRALAKLIQVLPARLRRRVDNLAGAITAHPFPAPAGAVDPDALVTLATAIVNHERLRFSYARLGSPPERRRVEPHALVAASRSWQLLTFDLDRDDWRTFRLDRATDLTATGVPATTREIPGGDAAAFIAASALRTTPTYQADIVIHAPADYAAHRLGEAARGTLADLSDGTCRWVSPPDTLDWLTLRLASLRLPFDVHGPPEVIAHIHAVGQVFSAATPTGDGTRCTD
jgi:predicted DNA-binding transcriptional regulator YafY